MAKHRVPKEGRSLFGSRKRDSLFERSFTRCGGCGDDVYVLAEDCRGCGAALNETREPEPVRHAQPVPQAHYAQLTRQSQPVRPPAPYRPAPPVHYAQLATQARQAAAAREVQLRAS